MLHADCGTFETKLSFGHKIIPRSIPILHSPLSIYPLEKSRPSHTQTNVGINPTLFKIRSLTQPALLVVPSSSYFLSTHRFTMSKITPVGQTLGTMANRIPSLVARAAVSAQESRALVLEELHGRVEYDSKCLIRRLALSEVPSKEVKTGLKAFRDEKDSLQRYEQGMKTRDEQGGERMMADALVSLPLLFRSTFNTHLFATL